MIEKENKKNRKMFIVADLVSLSAHGDEDTALIPNPQTGEVQPLVYKASTLSTTPQQLHCWIPPLPPQTPPVLDRLEIRPFLIGTILPILILRVAPPPATPATHTISGAFIIFSHNVQTFCFYNLGPNY